MLKVGLLKEIRNFDSRVGLSPQGVRQLAEAGLEVFVEAGAGEGCSFGDELYREAGATVVPSGEKLIRNAELLVKILPLSPVESELINDSHIVFSLLRLNPKGERLKSLLNSKTVYFAADFIEDQNGKHPVLAAISEVAGRMAVHVAANLLMVVAGGKGILLSGADVISPANVTIVGAGLIGRVAAVQAWKNGANVNLLSLKPENVGDYDIVRDGLEIAKFSYDNLKKLLPSTDVLIVSVYTLKNPTVDINISKDMIALMQPGSVLIDLSVEQTPVVETSHVTNIDQPTYIMNDVLHYCVPNISAGAPVTASKVYNFKILPFVELLAKNGIKDSLNRSPELLSSLVMYKGKVTNRFVADRYSFSFHNIFDLLDLNI